MHLYENRATTVRVSWALDRDQKDEVFMMLRAVLLFACVAAVASWDRRTRTSAANIDLSKFTVRLKTTF